MDRFSRALGLSGIAAAMLVSVCWPLSSPQAEEAKFDPSIPPAYTEPVVLASKDGVLEVQADRASRRSQIQYRGGAGQEHAAVRL